MAETAREEEVEYESDPEEAKLSLKMRRREASDDEEEGRDRENGERSDNTKPRRRIVDSDVESDGQGAAADYENEEEEEDYVEEEEDEELIEDVEYVEDLEQVYEERTDIRGVEAVANEEVVAVGGKESFEDRIGPKSIEALHGSNEDSNFDEIANENIQRDEQTVGEEEEKKENEPYAVPTAGAFYMHDDRFRDNSGGRHRYITEDVEFLAELLCIC